MRRLVAFGAGFGALAGALRVLSAFIPYAEESAPLEALYAVIDTGMMFGLLAVHLATMERTGWAGLAAFATALTGLASIVGPDAKMFGIDFYLLGAAVFSLGLAALSVLLLRARLMHLPAGLWIASAVLGVGGGAAGIAPAFVAAGVTLGAGFAVAGVGLLRA